MTLIDTLRGDPNSETAGGRGISAPTSTPTWTSASAGHAARAMGFLQDTGSWIVMPRRIDVKARKTA